MFRCLPVVYPVSAGNSVGIQNPETAMTPLHVELN
jgi:hypothetical protein